MATTASLREVSRRARESPQLPTPTGPRADPQRRSPVFAGRTTPAPATTRLATPSRQNRRWSSRQLHLLGAVASHAWAGGVIVVLALGWVAYGIASGFPQYWQAILESVTSIVTVTMVFAIQHREARDQIVTQRKLDELLRSIPQADNRLIAVEEAPDQELEAAYRAQPTRPD